MSSSLRRTRLIAAAAFCVALGAPTAAAAQAWYYPSFQIPRVVERDYTFGLVVNEGTGALFQWREGLGVGAQLALDAGLVDYDGGTGLFVGGNYAAELTRSTAEQPLDLLFTVGAGFTLQDGPDVLRIPVGVSLGHRFPLEGGLAITPYVHPRLSLDVLAGRRPEGADRTQLTIDFDIGGSFEVSRQLAIRTSLLLSGADGGRDVGFGIGLTYTPPPLRR